MLLKMKSIIKYYFLVEKKISTIHGNHQASRIDSMRGNGKVPEEKEVTYSKRTIDISKNSFGLMHDTFEVLT